MPCVMMLNASPNCGPKIIRTRSTTIATSTRMKTYSMIPCPRSPKRLIKLRATDSHLPSRRKWSKAALLPLLSTAPCGGESGSAVPPRCQPELALSAASVHSIYRLLLHLSLLLVPGGHCSVSFDTLQLSCPIFLVVAGPTSSELACPCWQGFSKVIR